MEIYRELERLKREREEQAVRLETERRRLEEQEHEQLNLVGRLEEQLRERHEAATALLTREDGRRLEDESRALAEIREALLRAKEACERPDGEEALEEVRAAQARYTDFKAAQVEKLGQLEEGLRQQKERLEKEVATERAALALLVHTHKDRQRQLKETQERGAQDANALSLEEQRIKLAEQRLLFKERQLAILADSHLPAVAEERQRATELLERGSDNSGGRDSPPGLDNTLFQVEKELEEKEERLTLHCASAEQLQQLHDTYEFTANVARQEEKVRRKEKEILESRGRQQREALEQAVARLERRHYALRRSVSLEHEGEEQKRKGAVLTSARGGPEVDQERVEREILKLKQRISESEGSGRSHSLSVCDDKSSHNSPVSPITSLPTVLPVADDRINAYIEEEVQRRLQKLNLLNGDRTFDLSFSSDSLKEEEEVSDSSSVRLTDEDDDKPQNPVNPRKLKYEQQMASVSLVTNSDYLKDPVKIIIPRYVLRGQGKDEHFEFEVKITVMDETWTVFRRYSRFREMHKTLKLKYPELAALEFPPKKLFGNRDERMVAERRNHLERYLRNFFRVMMSSSSGSPLRIDSEGGLQLSKHAICEFSPFFKKGVFDYSSHGTG